MKYMGSKNRIAKYILPIILKDRKPNQWYVEPFVGGCNSIDKVDGLRMGNDLNRYLIAMLEELQAGRIFQENLPKDIYDHARKQYYEKEAGKSGNYWGDADLGWVGFMASANGRFYEGGYSGTSNTKIGTVRDYISESIRNMKAQLPALKGVHLSYGDYREMSIPPDSIVYCDIPYNGTKQYSTSKNFDHNSFWEWAREISKEHKVYVSEYSAPSDFECIWEMEVKSSLSANAIAGGNKNSIERLFTLRSNWQPLPAAPETDKTI